jgi:hypothetical protein
MKMKMARLLLVLFAFVATTLSASATKPGVTGRPAKGGSFVHNKAAGNYWYYCYSDPDGTYVGDCDLGLEGCQNACAQACGGTCDWET